VKAGDGIQGYRREGEAGRVLVGCATSMWGTSFDSVRRIADVASGVVTWLEGDIRPETPSWPFHRCASSGRDR
jgi:hypothetical protein